MDNTYDDNKDDAFVVTVSRRDDIRPIFAVRFSRSGDEAKKKIVFEKRDFENTATVLCNVSSNIVSIF